MAGVPAPTMFDRPGDHSTMEGSFTTILWDHFGRRIEFNSFAWAIRAKFHFTTTEATPQRNQTTSKAQTSSKAAMKTPTSEETTHDQDKDSSGTIDNQMVAYTKSPIKPASYNSKDTEKYDQDYKDNRNNNARFKKITHICHRIRQKPFRKSQSISNRRPINHVLTAYLSF